MYHLIDDTIAAVASAPGWSARGIVRLSGPEAVRMAGELFASDGSAALEACPPRTRIAGSLRLERDLPPIPAYSYVFRAPRSYTRQDVVELHVPGSPVVISMALERLIAGGVRAAQPGEFTARAFLSGAMDLAQAEGVAGIIRARGDAELCAAQRLADGALSRRVLAVQDRLADLLALVEAGIDFVEEDIEFIAAERLGAEIAELRGGVTALRREGASLEALSVVPRVLLAGAPNAGKSSLLNALSGIDRALCSPLAGTTRDLLSAPLRLRSGEAVLVDSAGLGEPADDVDQLSAELTQGKLAEADLVVHVIDLAVETPVGGGSVLAAVPRARVLFAGNKEDLLDREALSVRCETLRDELGAVILPVSARTGRGLAGLKGAIEARLGGAAVTAGGEVIALNARHRDALAAADESLARAADLCRGSARPSEIGDLIAQELREALDRLGSIAGVVGTEELLGRVFSRFCVGK